jgi:hypothetical protein
LPTIRQGALAPYLADWRRNRKRPAPRAAPRQFREDLIADAAGTEIDGGGLLGRSPNPGRPPVATVSLTFGDGAVLMFIEH